MVEIDPGNGGGSAAAVAGVAPEYDPTSIPPQGVYISANAKLILVDNSGNTKVEYEVIRCQRSVIRWSNNVAKYFETGSQHATTYVLGFDVSGSFTRSFLNFAEARLVMGSVGGGVGKNLLNILKGDNNTGSFTTDSKLTSLGSFDFSRYPLTDLIVKTIVDAEGLSFGPIEISAHKPLFSNANVSFNAGGLIQSGPMDYIASYITIQKIEKEEDE